MSATVTFKLHQLADRLILYLTHFPGKLMVSRDMEQGTCRIKTQT